MENLAILKELSLAPPRLRQGLSSPFKGVTSKQVIPRIIVYTKKLDFICFNLYVVENFRVGLDIDISMEIKPRGTSGILMSVHGRRDFLLLQMVNGALIFSVDNGRGPIVATYIPPHEHHMCDGKWHYVQGME